MMSQPGGPQERAGAVQDGQRRRRQRHPKRSAAKEASSPAVEQQPMMLRFPPGLEPPRAFQAADEPAFIRTLPGLGDGAISAAPPGKHSELAGLLTDGVLVESGNVHSPKAGLCSALGLANCASTSAVCTDRAAAATDVAERQGAVDSLDSPTDGSTTASGASSPRSSTKNSAGHGRKASHSSSSLECESEGRRGSHASSVLSFESEGRRGSHESSLPDVEIEARRGSHASSTSEVRSEGRGASDSSRLVEFESRTQSALAYPRPCPPMAAPVGASPWCPGLGVPAREVLRTRHSWTSEAWCPTAQLAVSAGEFVRAWSFSRTAHGWLYAERLADVSMAGWLPVSATEPMPPGMRWMCAVRSWAAAQASQMHVQAGSVLLVSTSQRTMDGMVFAELPEDGASYVPSPRVLRGPQAGWVPIACLEWPAC